MDLEDLHGTDRRDREGRARFTRENENTLGFPREKGGIIRLRRSSTQRVLAPFCSLNILFLRRGPSQALHPPPVLQSFVSPSIDSHMHTYEKMRRGWDEDVYVPIPELLSIDRSQGGAAIQPRAACMRIYRMQISPYANGASGGMQMVGTCAPRLFRTLFRPARRRWSGTRPIFAYLGYFLSLYRDHCTVGFYVRDGTRGTYAHDGSKPLIRISHWIEPVPGLTDCLECSQDRRFRLLNVFTAAETRAAAQMSLRIDYNQSALSYVPLSHKNLQSAQDLNDLVYICIQAACSSRILRAKPPLSICQLFVYI